MTACARCGCPVTLFIRDPADHRRVCPCVVRVRDELALMPPKGQFVAVMVEGKREWWIVGPALPVEQNKSRKRKG